MCFLSRDSKLSHNLADNFENDLLVFLVQYSYNMPVR